MERNEMQTRSMQCELKTRAEPEGGGNKKVIEGYFAVFNKETQLCAHIYEEIAPEAFNKTLDKDIRALRNHDTSIVLGRNKSGTLELRVDDVGLYGIVYINENDTEAMNLYERVKRGDVSQCSFGFFIVQERADFREDGSGKWTLLEVDLFEVSICTFPAYEETGVSARGAELKAEKGKQFMIRKNKLKERIQNVTTSDHR